MEPKEIDKEVEDLIQDVGLQNVIESLIRISKRKGRYGFFLLGMKWRNISKDFEVLAKKYWLA